MFHINDRNSFSLLLTLLEPGDLSTVTMSVSITTLCYIISLSLGQIGHISRQITHHPGLSWPTWTQQQEDTSPAAGYSQTPGDNQR